jgi:hypothetical protein
MFVDLILLTEDTKIFPLDTIQLGSSWAFSKPDNSQNKIVVSIGERMSGIKNSNISANSYSEELLQSHNWFDGQESQSLAIEPIVWKKREVFHTSPKRRKVYRIEKDNRWHLTLVRTCGYVMLILKQLSPGAALKRSGHMLVLWAKKNG